MNMQYKKGVFEEKCEEYWKARKRRKSVILSSLVEVTGLTRKACIKRMGYLQLRDPCSVEQRGRPRYYTPDVIAALSEVWEIGSEACGENLHPQNEEPRPYRRGVLSYEQLRCPSRIVLPLLGNVGTDGLLVESDG